MWKHLRKDDLMELMKSYVTKNECYQVARKIDVKGLMLHSVGVPGFLRLEKILERLKNTISKEEEEK